MEIHKGNPPKLEGTLPCWRKILPSLKGIIFSRPDSDYVVTVVSLMARCSDYWTVTASHTLGTGFCKILPQI